MIAPGRIACRRLVILHFIGLLQVKVSLTATALCRSLEMQDMLYSLDLRPQIFKEPSSGEIIMLVKPSKELTIH
jgi:hypothetical protein